mgnify:CR=1 FL=1
MEEPWKKTAIAVRHRRRRRPSPCPAARPRPTSRRADQLAAPRRSPRPRSARRAPLRSARPTTAHAAERLPRRDRRTGGQRGRPRQGHRRATRADTAASSSPAFAAGASRHRAGQAVRRDHGAALHQARAGKVVDFVPYVWSGTGIAVSEGPSRRHHRVGRQPVRQEGDGRGRRRRPNRCRRSSPIGAQAGRQAGRRHQPQQSRRRIASSRCRTDEVDAYLDTAETLGYYAHEDRCAASRWPASLSAPSRSVLRRSRETPCCTTRFRTH